MILRRVITHFKKQEWTAIFLDFLIVVLGVFIGTNVTNWNDARKTEERSRTFTERLNGDLRAEYVYALALRDYNADVLKAGETAYDGLKGVRQVDERDILIGAFRATQFNWYERRRAAFDELVATSSLDLIKNARLRQIAIIYYNTPLFASMQQAGMTDSYRDKLSEILEPGVRKALRESCGDREYGSKGGAVGLLEIGYPCAPSLTDAQVSEAVSQMRADAELLPALRSKMSRASGWIYDIELTLKSADVAALFPEEGTP